MSEIDTTKLAGPIRRQTTLWFGVISTLLALWYVDNKRNVAAERVHRLALVAIPLVWLALQASNLLYL